MRVWCLGSGSSGNAFGFAAGGTVVLVDVGFGMRSLRRRADTVGFPLDAVEGVVLTHEHGDHASGAPAVVESLGCPVYATRGTLNALRSELADCDTRPLESRGAATIGTLQIATCPTPHDANEPVALVVSDPGGAGVGVAYDVGRPTGDLLRFLQGASGLILEANHDDEMLRTGPYPRSVQARIAGPRGHLSNQATRRMFEQLHHTTLAWVLLAHISRRCNRRDLALGALAPAAARMRFKGKLLATRQHRPMGPLSVGRPEQLTLPLTA